MSKFVAPVLLATAATAAPEAGKFQVNALLRQQMIDEINNTPGVTWKAGINAQFKDQPLDAVKALCGVKLEGSKAQIEKMPKHKFDNSTAIPESFDSEKNWPDCAKVIGDIRDQSMCGCCWAFGAASAASDRLCIASKGQYVMPLSAQDVCFNAEDDGCQGGFLGTPWDYISENGVTTGGQVDGTGPFGAGWCSAFSMPHCHHHGPQGKDPYPAEGTSGCPQQESPPGPTECDSTAKAPHNNFQSDRYTFKGETTNYPDERSIQQAIMTDGPVEAAFSVYADFANYVSGVYQHVSGSMMGGHAIRIVGWGVDGGVKYWKVANSWNPYWGENGYFRIKRGTDECGIEDQVTASPMGASWGPMQ